MNASRRHWLTLLAVALVTATHPAQAQRALGLGPAEGADGLAKEVGKRFAFVCPASDGTRASVYGTDVYTTDSGVCAAAIHAGVLKPGRSGVVSIVIGSGAESFDNSTRNGVTTKAYGRWGTSYTFARGAAPGQVSWQTVWSGIPADFNEPVAVECPVGGTLNGGVLWGTDVYTKDSTICVAAVHAGLITAAQGGVVVVQKVPGLKEYQATIRYGIASQHYGPYADAFSVTAGGRAVAAARSGSVPAASAQPERAAATTPVDATATTVQITTTRLPRGFRGASYGPVQITATAGSAAGYTWQVTSGALPAGMTIAAGGTPATTLSGMPASAGTFSFTVRVADSTGASDDHAYTLSIAQRYVIGALAGPSGSVRAEESLVGHPCTAHCVVNEGTTVRLTATPHIGYVFERWTGTLCIPARANPLDLRDVNTICMASFALAISPTAPP